MPDCTDFGYEVRNLQQFRRGTAPGHDHIEPGPPSGQGSRDLRRIEITVADCDIQFVENQEFTVEAAQQQSTAVPQKKRSLWEKLFHRMGC